MRLIVFSAILVVSSLIPAAEGGIIEKRVGTGCASNLKQLVLACQMFADVPLNGQFPATLKELVPNFITVEKSLRCLGMKDADAKKCQYIYVPGAKQDSADDIIAFCPCKGHAEGTGQYACADGSVKPIAKLADFRKLLKEQLDARRVSYEMPATTDKPDEKTEGIIALRRELDFPLPEEKK